MYHNNTNRKLLLQNYTYFYDYQSFLMSFNTLLYNLRHLQGTEKEGRGKQRRSKQGHGTCPYDPTILSNVARIGKNWKEKTKKTTAVPDCRSFFLPSYGEGLGVGFPIYSTSKYAVKCMFSVGVKV